jgi:hypothetical protein
MQPIYIKCFKEKFKKKSITNYILSANKNYASNDEIRLIIYSPLRGFNLYLDKNVEDYFNLYPTKWPKLEKIISISKYLNMKGFTLIEFNSLINLITISSSPKESYHKGIYQDITNVLQLVLDMWEEWN